MQTNIEIEHIIIKLNELIKLHNSFQYKQASPKNLRALIACDEEINSILFDNPELYTPELINFNINK